MDLRIFVEPQQGATYGTLLALAVESERLGYSAFFRSDHYLKMGSASGLPGPTDAWITLAGLARETKTIRLGTLVNSATFRFPGPLAISVAQVDEMSGGRVELGLGAGWFQEEHHAYGLHFAPLGERFERLEEQLAIVAGLWATEGGYAFEGAHYAVKNSPGLPKPMQSVNQTALGRPGVPIVIGGGGPKRTPRLAATYAAEFNVPFQSMENTAAQFGRVREACAVRGRDPKTLVLSGAQIIVCGRNDAEIAARAKAVGREMDELKQNGLCGTPDEIADKLRAWAGIGMQSCYLQILDLTDHDHLALIATEVRPLLS